jgi:hypothetical protein
MTTKHTPTPWAKAQAQREWTAEANFRCGSFSASQICAKGRKDPVCIVVQADPRGYGSGDAELDANVDFIVRACNAHNDLIAMLSEAAIQIEYMQERFANTGTGAAVASRCRALLAKVEACA